MKERSVVDAGTTLFQPDTLLPAQFFATLKQRSQACGERRLMAAILEDAVDCFQKYLWAKENRSRNLRQEAENWFVSDDDSWPFSFVNVCHALDLEPDFIRRGLLTWKERQLARRAALLGQAESSPVLSSSSIVEHQTAMVALQANERL
ncbi:MAG: hypothetical protein HYZ50_11230 [Deltaproteobacteria bacterium]|nr:hypothetical protein [Deltaproteobacteria bacterium]